MHRYVAYDLLIASDLPLPELVDAPPEAGAREPDLHIRLCDVPADIGAPRALHRTWAARPGHWLEEVLGVARFYVHGDGREVHIERAGGTDTDLRAFLFASTLGAIFHQRRQFALHACAVGMAGGAVAVAGHSGAGKSTTLAEFVRRGRPVLSDDKTVIRWGPEGPEVLGGSPTMRLCGDAVRRIGGDPGALPALREGSGKVLVRAPSFQPVAAPLRLLVVLGLAAETAPAERGPTTERLGAIDAVGRVLSQTYRRRIAIGLGLQAEHFAWATRLATAVPVARILRPRRGQTVEAVADAVEGLLAETLAS